MKAVVLIAAFALVWGAAIFIKAQDSPLPTIPQAPPPTNAPASPVRTTNNIDFTIGPNYADAPELQVRPNVPQGTLYDFVMKSEESKIYPGIAKGHTNEVVPYRRKVCVYVPQNYKRGTPAPFIVAQDGLNYRRILPTILDNMIFDHRLPPMIAIMINSGGGDSKGSERGLEYDTVSGTYATFIETEVLPRLTRDYHLAFTTDPNGRATMGGSSGGAAAFSMAWFHPELYRLVLSHSGTFVNQQSPVNTNTPHGAWEYHEHLIPQSDPKPIRVWLQVSQFDNGYAQVEVNLHNWVLANQRMEEALKAKGYSYRYVFAEDAKHNDSRVVRQTLPGALEWLWQDYPR